MQEIAVLEQHFLGNPLSEFILCFSLLLVGLLFKRYGATFLSKQSLRLFKGMSGNQHSDLLVALIRKPFERLLMLLIVFFAFDRLTFPESWNLVPVDHYGLRWFLFTLWMIAMFLTATRLLLRATDYFAHLLSNREESPVSPELANFIKELIKVLLMIMCLFAALNFIFHVNITALVASLGIGGLAVALAAQDTLANLLGSFIIYLDKPFRVGDAIESGDIRGSVEHVGFRTTRVRTLDKSLLTVPNKKLIDTALNNITMSEVRRVRFTIGLTYNSKVTQLQSIINDIKTVVHDHPKVTPDFTVRFDEFDKSSLQILIVYFVKSNEYDQMIEVKEEINIQIMHIVEKHGCAFAYPTQTIYLEKQ